MLKIWPAKDLENMKGGHGIILDDVAAGFQTLIFILLILKKNFSKNYKTIIILTKY